MARIAVIDADLIGRKRHRFPNLACMKLSGYHKGLGDEVLLKTDYEELDAFERVYISKVFTDTEIPEGVLDQRNVSYGGTGFYYDKAPKLPEEVEHHMPDYHLYDGWVEEKLAAGELDFCALPLYPKNPLLDYEVIHQEEIFLAVPRNHPVNALITPSSGISYIDLRLVRNEPFVSLKSIQKFSEMSHQLCEEAGFTPRTICETLNWDTVDTLVGTGLGVGFVPEVLVKAPTTENSPNYYRISAKAFRPYAIVTQKNSTISHPAMLIIDYFRKAFQGG